METTKTLLIFENDHFLDPHHHSYVYTLKEKYEGNVTELLGLASKTIPEIYAAVLQATDIAVQTCFVNGSDSQLHEMIDLFAKIPASKNIYIALLGDDLTDYFKRYIDEEQLWSIRQHNIYELSTDLDEEGEIVPVYQLLDFTQQISRHELRLQIEAEKIQAEIEYAKTAQTRPTGRQIKILGCQAQGTAFRNLPLGEVVPELDMSETDPNPQRGIWIWGNGEVIKLVNDIGFQEYAIVSPLTLDEILVEISKATDAEIDNLSSLEIRGLYQILSDVNEDNLGKANALCEELDIPKRGNRQKIVSILNQQDLVNV